MQQSAQPSVFNDDIATRALQVRFRGIGNPYQFLDSIGIVPIKEFLYRGATLIDVADLLNVPLTAILLWIEENNLGNDFQDAARVSAEGYLYQAQKALRDAKDTLSLNKAKAMLEHARFMASKKDKTQYGTTQELPGANAGVTYIFNMGEQQAQKAIEAMPVPVEAEFKEVEPVTISLDFTSALGPVPDYLEQARVVKPAITPVDEPSDVVRDVDKW